MRVNYVRTWEPARSLTDPAVVVAETDVKKVRQFTQYVDGLGRPLQTVAKGGSPAKKDMVAPVIYDAFGREQYQYLPYVSTAGDGAFKTNPFNDQKNFYVPTSGMPIYPGEQVFYGQTQYEASPLGRVLKTMAPGNSWAGSGVGISQQYLVNTVADSVRIWTIASAEGSIPVSTTRYNAGELYKHVITDEAGSAVVEYKDKEGRVVLKKVQLATTPGTGHVGWLNTYYVYDNLNNLRYVLPPKAVEILLGNGWSLADPALRRELCFRYEYDTRQRMILKQVPGAEPMLMIYDVRDRLVFAQDGQLRLTNQWLTTFYDWLNRPAMTALYQTTLTVATLRSQLAAATAAQTITQTIPGDNDLVINSHDGRSAYKGRASVTALPGFEVLAGEVTLEIDPAVQLRTEMVIANNPLPNLDTAKLYALTYTHYDDYSYSGAKAPQSAYYSAMPAPLGNTAEIYPEALSTHSGRTRGVVTGSKVRVLDTDQWLVTTIYYNDKGRVQQVLADNISGGADVVTNQYDFLGQLLTSIQDHFNQRSGITPHTKLVTRIEYDHAGRIKQIGKKLNDSTEQIVASNTYDALGQLAAKALKTSTGANLETLDYKYNIRGWLSAINKDYVTSGSGDHFFGQELSYDYGFTSTQKNGNIAGIKWRGFNDPVARAYGFGYDKANRLLKADFNQQVGTSSTWNVSAGYNFSVTMGDGVNATSAYDANGNIRKMVQNGRKGTGSPVIDSLIYSYYDANQLSNKLKSVTDGKNDPVTTLGDFREAVTGGVIDYVYDANGNMVKDHNKQIDSIRYNHLDLPEHIHIKGKGNIAYIYDAAGIKHRKVVTDSTASPVKVTTTDYVGGFVYQQDSLQFASHEEGRIRTIYAASQPVKYVFDYFLKDHLGNVRTVLTAGQQETALYLASMETETAAKENVLFSNIDATRTSTPTGYPQDATNQQNSFVAKLNGENPDKKIGPSLVLKVMAGDTIQIGAKAYYKSGPTPQNKKTAPPEDMLNALISAFTGSQAPGQQAHGVGLNAAINNTPFNNYFNNTYQRLKDKDNDAANPQRPKAYLNFVLFDEQFNLVEDNSGVKQVQATPDELQTLAQGKMVMEKSGFLYVYTSNESPQDVFFDNVGVMSSPSQVLEETHYYPFGLTMAGISTSAPNRLANKYLYNKKELQNKEFGDGSGLEWYDYGARMYDPQLGRWHSPDPLSDQAPGLTPFRYAFNSPVNFIDLYGLYEGWYENTQKEVKYDERINNQGDLAALGIAGRYLGKEGYRVNEDNGRMVHYNRDGSKSEGPVTLSGVTVHAGLINGFPAEMVQKARTYDYYKGSWEAFQDGIRSQERSFTFVTDYVSPMVQITTSFGLEGLAVSGPVKTLMVKFTPTVAKNVAKGVLKPLGLGSTGRTTAANLVEQMTMKEAMANPQLGTRIMEGMKDSRWLGWTKMEYKIKTAEGINAIVHYVGKWEKGVLKAVDDFKFK